MLFGVETAGGCRSLTHRDDCEQMHDQGAPHDGGTQMDFENGFRGASAPSFSWKPDPGFGVQTGLIIWTLLDRVTLVVFGSGLYLWAVRLRRSVVRRSDAESVEVSPQMSAQG